MTVKHPNRSSSSANTAVAGQVKDVTLDGGIMENDDETYAVYCMFNHIRDQRVACLVNAWLADLIQQHVNEIVDAGDLH